MQDKESLLKFIVKNLRININEAKRIIKEADMFCYYDLLRAQKSNNLSLLEATVDLARNNSPTASRLSSAITANNEPQLDNGELVDIEDSLGQTTPGEIVSRSNSGQYTVKTNNGTKVVDKNKISSSENEKSGVLSGIKNTIGSVKNSFNKGMNIGSNLTKESEELQRIKTLAGLEETASCGGVSAGGIASIPSIIGDTSDSHKPSTKLRKRQREKSETSATKSTIYAPFKK